MASNQSTLPTAAPAPPKFDDNPAEDPIIPATDPSPKDSIEDLKQANNNTHTQTFVPAAPQLPIPPQNLKPPQFAPHERPTSMESLRDAEQVRRKHFHKASNHHARYSYKDLYRVRGSVIPRVLLPSLVLTLWGTLWTLLFMVGKVKGFVMDTLLITVLGVVMGLLLVFRTNTAYDRYWEGRRTWSLLLTHIRNLSRFVWVGVLPKEDSQQNEKRGAMNLLLAYAVATKHYLRDEPGYRYKDLRHLVAHLPELSHGMKNQEIKNMPLEISFHIAAYVARCRKLDLIDAAQGTAMTNALSAMIDCLTNFERIRNSPIPLAYSIHLKQTLMLYLLSLPFQLVAKVYWGTIPVMLVASFTLLGIESIGGEIENPFGYDDNDLPVEKFCDDTRIELNSMMHRSTKIDPTTWGRAVMIADNDISIDIGGIRQRKDKKDNAFDHPAGGEGGEP
ncbi:hypothetical protein HK097_009704, partial [Rhizophlyctis rosea]